MTTRRDFLQYAIGIGLAYAWGKTAAHAGEMTALKYWDMFEKDVRDGRPKHVSVQDIGDAISALRTWSIDKYPGLMQAEDEEEWAFPIKGGSIGDVGFDKKPGDGFHPDWPKPAYSWFDGTKHGGHAAHDIFFPDKNNDCLDDRTGEPAEVVSVAAGIVANINDGWKPGSRIRGGNYVCAFSPKQWKIFYYCHMDEIYVKPGELLKKGRPIGTLGKTGAAWNKKPKTPCHLHLSVLKYTDRTLVPVDYFDKLRQLATVE